jgi:superfamily II DNA or RNA helicase
MAPKYKKEQKNKSVPKKITIKKRAITKTTAKKTVQKNTPKKITIKKKSVQENTPKKITIKKKSVLKNNKPKVLKEKLVPYKSIKEEFPLIEPAFWVLQNNKRFPAWINKTFIKYKLTDKTKIKSIDGKFKPFPYQLFLRDYMQNASPYRGILLMHFLGSGKTCSAVTIAENLKTDKNIVAIMPASLKGNFIGTEKEGLLFCGDPKYKSNPKLIDEHYTFISSNASNTIQQLNSVELDNHLIIIDEAHNLVSRMFGGLAGDNKQGRAIYNKLMDAKDCKIVALTGTPVVNDIYEAGILMNILHGYMYLTVFDIVYVSPKYGANWNLRQLEEELEKKEYIDYVQINKANKTIEFHLNIKPWHQSYREKLTEITDIAKGMEINIQYNTYIQFTLFPDEPEKGVEEFNKYFIDQDGSSMKNVELFKRRIMGLVSYYKGKKGNLPAIKTDEYVEVNMSPYQFSEYEKVRGEEKTSRKLSEIRVFTRQYSNFVFPGDIPRPGIGERVSKKGNSANMQNESIAKVMKAGENDEDASEVKREELKRYQKAVDMALNELSANADKYLVKDKLGMYSNKMKAMLENIEKTNGLIFVYSDFRSLEGVEIFSRVLNANGYAKYGEDNKLPKYAMYTGSEDLEERNKIKKIFSSPENKYGRDIKIILATSAGAEGLDLKNIRQVHIMEPYWNNVRIKQVIGRAVRRNSHIELPPNERDVSIYRYMSLIRPEDQKDLKPKERLSADQIILEIAKRKEKITDEMINAMKGGAVDCVLNAIDNEGNISCMSFGESVDGISYVPRIGKDLGRGTESEMRKVEQKLRHGAIDIDGIVYFIEGKKLYKVSDKLKRNPIMKIPKIRKKVAVDLESREIYDHEAAMVSKTKIKLGVYNNSSKYIKS